MQCTWSFVPNNRVFHPHVLKGVIFVVICNPRTYLFFKYHVHLDVILCIMLNIIMLGILYLVMWVSLVIDASSFILFPIIIGFALGLKHLQSAHIATQMRKVLASWVINMQHICMDTSCTCGARAFPIGNALHSRWSHCANRRARYAVYSI